MHKKYFSKEEKRIAKNKWAKQHRPLIKDKLNADNRIRRENNKKEINEKRRHRYKTDVVYRNNALKNTNKYGLIKRKERKQLIINNYGGKCSCEKCPETNVAFLTVDHINNDGAKDLTSSGHRRSGDILYRYIINNNYPDKFRLLCINCNWGRHYHKGICPHLIEL